MLLFDRRLRFARALTEHWLEIRGGAMVPLDEDIDPRALVGCFNFIGIADLMQPAQVIIELAGAGMRRRFGRDIRDVDWVDLVPPALGEAGKRARERIRSDRGDVGAAVAASHRRRSRRGHRHHPRR
jgi:hypothetical protein